MLGLAGFLALAVGATEVSVTVLPGAPCVAQPALVRKLRASGLRVLERGEPETLVVRLSGEKRQLLVRARSADLPFERRVPASLDDCAAVERVTVALITAWAATSAAERPDAGAQVIAPLSPGEKEALEAGVLALRGGSTRNPGELPALDAGALARGGADETPAIPRDLPRAGPLAEGAFDAGPAAPPPVSEEVPRADGTLDAGLSAEIPLEAAMVDGGAAASSAPLRVEAAVLGGVSGAGHDTGAGPTPVATVAGSVLAGLSFGRWGVLLEAGLESERSARLDPVRVSAALQWLGLCFRVTFELLESLTLDLALGARGWRIVARATGVDVAFDKNELTAGPALSAGLSWRVAGPLFLHLRPSVALRVQPPLSFNVDPVGRVLLLEPWSVGATLGVLFRFE